ncbi:uncharacterized protein TM35_000083740 [Trypanosoma theileri]|uniref:F-box domain-containing protein n=1 Tax=Trypanosoma theileri TaxID=67003 RepID=A0A1X0P0W8_9TRYP|nr:uncharacterized protein TM35_000083740 [Trypanosoma theileri]ORC90576.1 hypothetical protein TM35_000083740 [Trypanosoma theileri]
MSWAEKARGSHSDHRSIESNELIYGINTLPKIEEVDEQTQKQLNGNCSSVMLRGLPGDTWDIITSFLNFRDVQLVSSTCRTLWHLLHRRDNIWRSQIEYFHQDMQDLRGDGRLLCTEFLIPSSCSMYERMKMERRLYALDAQRDWQFREYEKNCGSEGIFSSLLTLDEELENNNYGWGEEEVTPLLQIRVLRPLLLTCDTNDPNMNPSVDSGSRKSGNNSGPAIRSPSEYLTLCDNINHGDFTGALLGVQDCTEEEDELFLFAILQTLRRAKQRPPPRYLPNETRTSHHQILRYFGGKLLSICRYEAEQLLLSVLHMRGVLDDFVLYSNPHTLGSLSALKTTRYFIAPELCRRGRVGLIVVDPVRILVVVRKDRGTCDDPRWDEEYTAATLEGGATHGSGMNPQNLRRF